MTSYDTLDLFGTGWMYTPTGGTPMAISSGDLPGGTGILMGTLLNGDAFDLSYNNQDTLEVNVGAAPAPEPSQTAALALGGLGLAGLTLRARRRSVSQP